MTNDTTTAEQFRDRLKAVTDFIGSRELDRALQDDLNAAYPPDSETFQRIFADCRSGIAQGWMCNREGGGIRYGRVVKPDATLNNFSVDVVDMESLQGPHHAHPNGEIDLIMPLSEDARFDGHGAGWLVYGPGSAHHPTVSSGRALVLYLLPKGAIEFTR